MAILGGILALFLIVLAVREYLSSRRELKLNQEAEKISRANEIEALREIFRVFDSVS